MAPDTAETTAQPGGGRHEQAARLHDQLTDQVNDLVNSDKWKAFLDFSRSFHSYSLNNVLLALAQRPSATDSGGQFAGFRGWQEKGRQVRRGEKAIKIFGYSTKQVTEEDPETGEEVTRTRVRYPILNVFALDQTDPIDGVEDHSTVAHRLLGADPAGIYQKMAARLAEAGWQVDRKPVLGPANGYTTVDGSRCIVIDDQLSPAMAARVILHEGAHAWMHVDPDTGLGWSPQGDGRYLDHRGVAETEAEAVSYVLAGMANLDTSDYSVGYVAGWTDGDPDKVRDTAASVLQAVHQLAPTVQPEPDPEPDPEPEPAGADRTAENEPTRTGRHVSQEAASTEAGQPVDVNPAVIEEPDHAQSDVVESEGADADQGINGYATGQTNRKPTAPPLRSRYESKNSLREAALAAASRGWHVFPLAPDGKTPVVKGWQDRATTDQERIERCWTPTSSNHGRWNLGVACGPSGLLVVDLDTAKPGDPAPDEYEQVGIRTGAQVLADLEGTHQDLPATYIVDTPSRGRHLYFARPQPEDAGVAEGGELGNTAGRLGWLIDTRGAGGYVVGAGSIIDGRRYTALDADAEVAALPRWLADQLSTDQAADRSTSLPEDPAHRAGYVEAAVRGEVSRILSSSPHTHNNALFVASAALGRLIASGDAHRPAIRGALVAAGEAVGQPPDEARATVDSGLNKTSPAADHSTIPVTRQSADRGPGEPPAPDEVGPSPAAEDDTQPTPNEVPLGQEERRNHTADHPTDTGLEGTTDKEAAAEPSKGSERVGYSFSTPPASGPGIDDAADTPPAGPGANSQDELRGGEVEPSHLLDEPSPGDHDAPTELQSAIEPETRPEPKAATDASGSEPALSRDAAGEAVARARAAQVELAARQAEQGEQPTRYRERDQQPATAEVQPSAPARGQELAW